MTALTRLRTFAALGPASIARVGAYRLGLRAGLHPAQRIAAAPARGPFYRAPSPRRGLPIANGSWNAALWWFGWHEESLPNGAPDWRRNPFGARGDSEAPWWRIGEFAAGAGDIKGLWELSRFDWLVAYATCAANGDAASLGRLNLWLADWSATNPPYRGPNWKCGQEASIRVMHLLLAAIVLGQEEAPEPGLVDLIAAHLQRIAPTMSYAIGQQNNHGTSEAAALFVGGDFLAGAGDARGPRWSARGRRWLEERAAWLIEPDGSFSQYSLNYHRVMLDTYSFAEAWRGRHGLPAFSPRMQARLGAATHWLRAFVDPASGDAPNLGANDGARLLPLTATDYRDFRPSLQLAAALWLDARAIREAGAWDSPADWLGVGRPEALLPAPGTQSFDDGGYHVLRAGTAAAFLRYPRFRFRPSQSDALHLDLWVGGRNLLRDAGSFSYNVGDAGSWFAGTAAHNTVEFDGRDQMPRLGRFLFGDWLGSRAVELARDDADGARAAAGYCDRQGARHHRVATLRARGLTCVDELSGRFEKAIARWRLAPGEYRLEGDTLAGESFSLAVAVEGAAPRLTLARAPESPYYLRQHEIPVLEIGVDRPCRIVTEARF
jgi:Heparinase II/III-like protein